MVEFGVRMYLNRLLTQIDARVIVLGTVIGGLLSALPSAKKMMIREKLIVEDIVVRNEERLVKEEKKAELKQKKRIGKLSRPKKTASRQPHYNLHTTNKRRVAVKCYNYHK